jgi:hypothetical protein
VAKTRTVIETVTDDIDGSSKNIETVTFSLDGVAYEIDLGPKNAKALRDDFATWVGSARKAKKSPSAGRRRSSAPKPVSEAKAIREWALASGIAVPARGRIPASVAEQYANA